MNDGEMQVRGVAGRELGWPAATTLIAAIVGAAVTTVAWAFGPLETDEVVGRRDIVSTREVGEIKARLTAIEQSNRQMRTELRSEIKDVRDLVRQLLKQQ